MRKLSRHRPQQAYLGLCLSKENHHKNMMVHTLVLLAFVGPSPEGYVCNHKDGNPTNNRLDNLEWVTTQENTAHATRLGLMPHGERAFKAKLIAEQVREIRTLATEGIDHAHLAVQFGVTRKAIKCIVERKHWKHVE